METATIRFNNGTELKVQVNGTCFITDEKPDFPTDLSKVEIETVEGVTVIEDAKMIECASGFEPGYWFTFLQKDESDKIEQQRADIDYIAAMVDIEL